jgi:ABC-type transport system substrate-binding protein
LLDAAGFDDIDDDDIREAPDGSEFDVLVECAQSSNIAIEVGQKAAEALTALGIDAVSTPTDFYEYLNRLYFHGDFDMVFLGSSFNNFDVDWLAYEYWSEYANEPYWNFANWQNSTYDGWRDQLLHSTDYEDVYEAAIEMQRIWVHSSPQIICYENTLLSAYRTDKFEGFVNDVSDGVPGWWTNYKVHLKDSEGGPFGGTFRWSNPLDLDSFNFMVSSSAYTANVLNQLYDSLMTQDDQGNDVLWLAESYTAQTHADNPDITDGHTRFTFNLIQNATWTDGTRLTAADVAFSLNYFRDAPGNPYGADLGDMTAAYAPTDYTVVVEFDTESYWHLHTVAYKPVIPKAVFEDIGLEGWNLWNPDPPTTAMVTSGPFNVSDYVAGEFVELTYNPNYYYGLDRALYTNTEPTGGVGDLTMAIVAGAVGAAVVILVGGYVLMRQR